MIDIRAKIAHHHSPLLYNVIHQGQQTGMQQGWSGLRLHSIVSAEVGAKYFLGHMDMRGNGETLQNTYITSIYTTSVSKQL